MKLFCLMGSAAALLALSACGTPDPTPVDSGVDSSCGIDCEAQAVFGLIPGRCFEYSDTQQAQEFPALGVWVQEAQDLETVKVIPVQYQESGVIRMTDYFMFAGKELRLARRSWVGQSVTYRDGDGAILGVAWFPPGTAVGQNFTSNAEAVVSTGSSTQTEGTSFTVVTSPPSASERTVPHGEYADAIKLIFNEQPAHGMDGRRIIQPDLGVTLFSTTFTLSGTGSSTEYRLQDVREITAGTHGCGLSP